MWGRERRERRLEIKTRKTLLTELVTPGYLFMGLLKRTLEQSALPSSQQACFASDGLLSITNQPRSRLLCLTYKHMHALDTFLSRLTCPGIPVIQAKPCQVEESLSQGGDSGGGGVGGGGELQ